MVIRNRKVISKTSVVIENFSMMTLSHITLKHQYIQMLIPGHARSNPRCEAPGTKPLSVLSQPAAGEEHQRGFMKVPVYIKLCSLDLVRNYRVV